MIIIPPIPITRTTELINKLRLISKSTLFSTKILRPEAAITPKSAIDAPPITGAGIVGSGSLLSTKAVISSICT